MTGRNNRPCKKRPLRISVIDYRVSLGTGAQAIAAIVKKKTNCVLLSFWNSWKTENTCVHLALLFIHLIRPLKNTVLSSGVFRISMGSILRHLLFKQAQPKKFAWKQKKIIALQSWKSTFLLMVKYFQAIFFLHFEL